MFLLGFLQSMTSIRQRLFGGCDNGFGCLDGRLRLARCIAGRVELGQRLGLRLPMASFLPRGKDKLVDILGRT